MRGYFGIGIENCKKEINVGGLFRSCQAFGCNFLFTIGKRYKKQSSDTTKAYRHIPLFSYETFEEFYDHLPYDCRLVGVEFPHASAHPIGNYIHPERCIYLLGAEDHGLTKIALEKCHHLIYIPVKYCLNVATAGSIVMYDRTSKNES